MQPLIQSKLKIPPLRTRVVARPDLLEKLEQGLSSKVILVSAPAGFGKTTLILQWLEQFPTPPLWLSLEEADDNPQRFFMYWLTALQSAEPRIGNDLLRILSAGQVPPIEVLAGQIANDLSQLPSRRVFVCDDFHTIQNEFIHQFFRLWINYQPASICLVLVTREDPPLPLPQLRARNELTEIRAIDLRFSEREASQFLTEVMDIRLPLPTIRTITARTEGWITGLQLAGLSLRGSDRLDAFLESLSGTNRFILSYLSEEVINKQPEDIQNFLLKTSILGTLTAQRCDLLTNRQDSAEILENLLRANLFIVPLDDHQQLYRYHHLFSDLLRNRLQRVMPDQIHALNMLASQAYQAEGLLIESIEHLLAAGEYNTVIQWLETHIWKFLNEGFAPRIEQWLDLLPQDLHITHPHTLLGMSWLYLLRGNFSPIQANLDRVSEYLDSLPEESEEGKSIRAELLALQSNLHQVMGRFNAALEAAQLSLDIAAPDMQRIRALAYLGLGGSLRQSGRYLDARSALLESICLSRASDEIITEILAVSHLTLMSLEHGELFFAHQIGSEAIQQLEQRRAGYPAMLGAVFGALGLVNFEWNEIEKARKCLERGVHLATLAGHNASAVYTHVGLARLCHALGEETAAEVHLQEAERLFRLGAPGWVFPALAAWKVILSTRRGNRPMARAILDQLETQASKTTQSPSPIDLARIWWLLTSQDQEDWHTALELASKVISTARNQQRTGILLEGLILSAILHAQLKQQELAVEDVHQALIIAQPQRYQRIFLDAGAEIVPLLRKVNHPASVAYAKEILRLMNIPLTHPSSSTPTIKDLIDPLSEREQQVLSLLAQGLSYSQVADELVISLNTVRFHIKSIYAKLGVNKISQAIEKAKDLRLLES